MNKLIFSIIAISLFLILSTQVSAQTSSAASSCSNVPALLLPLPGTCGIASDPCNNRCCVNKTEETTKPLWMFELPFGIGDKIREFFPKGNPVDSFSTASTQININPCIDGVPSTPGDLSNSGCVCLEPSKAPLEALKKMCANIKDGGEKGNCESCLGGVGQEVGVWTSIGCVRSNLGSFIQETLFGWGIGVAGGVSLLCIMYAAFMMQTSSGNAEKIKKAQQLMTSCITGLMVIIFSVFILQLIGVKILRIPGFN